MAAYEKTDILPLWRWAFRQFVSPNGRHVIDDWRKAMPSGPFRADMDTFLKILAKKAEWTRPDIKPLKGKPYRGLTELRWPSGKIQHRIIGLRLRDVGSQRQYLMLLGCTHKNNVYDPHDALDSAVRNKKKLDAGEATTSEYKLPTDR